MLSHGCKDSRSLQFFFFNCIKKIYYYMYNVFYYKISYIKNIYKAEKT